MRLAAALAFLVLMGAPARAETPYEALDAYAFYQSDVSALLDLDVDSPEAIDGALERAARHDPAAVTRGWIAYGALTAAQSPAFAAGVLSRARAAGRAPVLRQLRGDMTYARRRPSGSGEAIQLILSAAAADSARLANAGARYEDLGDTLDTTTWIVSEDRDAREARLRQAEAPQLPETALARLHIGARIAAPLTDPDAFGGARFWDALAGRASAAPPAQRPRDQRGGATTDRMLTLAALIVLGAADSESARVDALLDAPPTRACLTLEQLEFRQCASVAHDANEDAFCLARHGLNGPSACFSAIMQ